MYEIRIFTDSDNCHYVRTTEECLDKFIWEMQDESTSVLSLSNIEGESESEVMIVKKKIELFEIKEVIDDE